jgi:hypothetical protein
MKIHDLMKKRIAGNNSQLSTLKKERYVFNEETNQQQETMIIDDSYIMLYYCLAQ